MLRALRTNNGWPRAIALVLLLAFSAGLLHVHASGASAAPVAVADAVADVHGGHDHDGAPVPNVTPHCAFCAVVTGKFYVPEEMPAFVDVVGAPIIFGAAETRLTSTPLTDLFRPPIPFIG